MKRNLSEQSVYNLPYFTSLSSRKFHRLTLTAPHIPREKDKSVSEARYVKVLYKQFSLAQLPTSKRIDSILVKKPARLHLTLRLRYYPDFEHPAVDCPMKTTVEVTYNKLFYSSLQCYFCSLLRGINLAVQRLQFNLQDKWMGRFNAQWDISTRTSPLTKAITPVH